MKYYLPITINDRRLHVCHLEEQTPNNTLKPIFSFIINNGGNDLQVFAVNTNDAKLISTDGYDNDVKLSDLNASIEYKENNIDSLPTYYVNLDKKKQITTENGLVIKGSFNNPDKPFCVNIDKTVMPTAIESFVVVIRYKTESKEFSYSFKIHLCEKSNLIEAAMDFGSEASQVLVKSDGTNMRLVSVFEKFHANFNSWTWGKDDKGNDDIDYWQGKSNNELYKSVFFIHPNPKATKIEDEPNKNEAKNFIQTLTPKNFPTKDLIMLPNLKLVELLHSSNWQGDINFTDGNPFNGENSLPLSSPSAKDGILRMVLNNFLYCILKNKHNSKENRKRFLRLILLMPNVYFQKKVYKIIKNLYEDFEQIRLQKDYQQYAGIEIQMISESDSAFIGARKEKEDFEKKIVENGYFLIIDAGKGTTDFSILRRQNDKRSVFDSLYRNGIPASGHFLTFAFYEALRDFLNSENITLKDKVENALKNDDKSTLLNFMTILEQFKINYDEYSFDGEVATDKLNASSASTLDGITSYLKENLIDRKKHIPNVKEKVNDKIKSLVDLIEKKIKSAIEQEQNFRQFTQILLTGRGFLFMPFQNAVKDMLTNNGWITDRNHIHSYSNENNKAKIICLEGAFRTEEIIINDNSELIGRSYTDIPPIQTKWLHKKLKNRFDRWLHKRNRGNFLNKDFFYNGITGIQSTNLNVFISGRKIENDILRDDDSGNERRIYFIGEGFIVQNKGTSKPIEENLNENMNDKVKQTLFPFYSDYPASFNNENIITSQNVVFQTAPQEGELIATTNNPDNMDF